MSTYVVGLIVFMCVFGGIFMILELDRPLEGLIQVSSESLRSALARLGE